MFTRSQSGSPDHKESHIGVTDGVSSRPSVSAVIISCEEAEVIEQCLQSVAGWVDEIVVVDMHSQDGTREIVGRYTDRIVEHERVPYVEPVRNFAMSQATRDWIILLDPDERVPEPLARELLRIAATDSVDVVNIPFETGVFGIVARSQGASDTPKPRFFRRGVVSWPAQVHTGPDLSHLRCYDIPSGRYELSVLHDTWRTVPIVLDKIMRYAPKDVERLHAAGVHFSFSQMVRVATRQFIERMFIGRAYEDGMPGFLTALYFTIYTITIHAELWEAEGRPAKYDRQVRRWGKRLSWLARTTYGGVHGVRRLTGASSRVPHI